MNILYLIFRKPQSPFVANDSSKEVTVPIVAQSSRSLYESYVQTGIVGPTKPSKETMDIYTKYIAQRYM